MISNLLDLLKHYEAIKETALSGRYINAAHISKPLEKASAKGIHTFNKSRSRKG